MVELHHNTSCTPPSLPLRSRFLSPHSAPNTNAVHPINPVKTQKSVKCGRDNGIIQKQFDYFRNVGSGPKAVCGQVWCDSAW